MSQSPIKVSDETKERVRFLAALIDTSQANVVDRAVQEFATRHSAEIEQGMNRARSVLAGGDAAIAAHLLGRSVDDVNRVAGRARSTASQA